MWFFLIILGHACKTKAKYDILYSYSITIVCYFLLSLWFFVFFTENYTTDVILHINILCRGASRCPFRIIILPQNCRFPISHEMMLKKMIRNNLKKNVVKYCNLFTYSEASKAKIVFWNLAIFFDWYKKWIWSVN